MELGNEYSSQGDYHVGQVWQQAVGREQLEARFRLGGFAQWPRPLSAGGSRVPHFLGDR